MGLLRMVILEVDCLRGVVCFTSENMDSGCSFVGFSIRLLNPPVFTKL